MSGGSTRRIDETFQRVTDAGNAGQYDREQILEEINRLKGSGAPQLLTDLGKSWYDAAGKLDELRSRVQSVGDRLAEAWRSRASAASQRALMHIHDAAQDLSGTADGMHRYTDQVGATMTRHLAGFPGGDGRGAVEGFMGDYGRVLASGMAGPAGLVPGNPAGQIGEAVYGTVGGWVDSGLNVLGLGGEDPNQESQEALAALNRDLVADNEIMPSHVSIELPQIEPSSGRDERLDREAPPGGGLSGESLPAGVSPGGGASDAAGGGPGLPGVRAGGLPSDTGSAQLVQGTPGESRPYSDGPSGGLAGAPGGPSMPGGSTSGAGHLPGGGAGTGGGVPGGTGVRPGISPGAIPMGTAGTGTGGSGIRNTNAGGALGRGTGPGGGRAGAGMVPLNSGGAGDGGGTGTSGRPGTGRSVAGRMAGGMMPMGGAGGRGHEDERSSRETWLVEDNDPWGGSEADDLPPGVIR